MQATTSSNGKIERWHKTLKGDCIRVKVPLSLDDARQIVSDYTHHYNTARLHSAIGYVTPKDKLDGNDPAIFKARDRKLADARDRRARLRQAQHQSQCQPTVTDPQCQPAVTPRPPIDFDAVKAAVTIAAVLQLLGSSLHGRGAQQRGPCPLHGSTSGNALDLWSAATRQTPYDAAVDLCARLAIPLPILVSNRNREEEPVAPLPAESTMTST